MLAMIGVLADTGDNWGHMGGWDGGWMWLSGVVMMGLFVVLIVWLVRSTGAGSSQSRDSEHSTTNRAREILAERYARGELSTEEYREHVEELQ